VAESDNHQFNWKFLVVIPAVLSIVYFWPQLVEVLSDLEQIPRTVLTTADTEKEVVAETPRQASFDEVLGHALRSERQGDRQMAHLAFQQLLKKVASASIHTEQSAALLPRAAAFYSKGDELRVAEVESLYLQALKAIDQVHGENYYDYENAHWGLEKLYLSLARYDEAVFQTRLLLDFYRRYYKDESTQHAFVAPTTVRLGHHLMKAGRNIEARDAYHAAVELWRSVGQPTSAIEAFIETTYLPGETRSDSTGNLKAAIEAIQMDGITVEQISEDDNRVTIAGFADDNTRVAAYLRLLKDQLSKPELNFVESGRRQEKTVSEFSIAMKK